MSGLGHIGELQVIEHLQSKENFTVYLPMKDKGIDFIAVKNNLSTQVQVKTSKYQKTAISGLPYQCIRWGTVQDKNSSLQKIMGHSLS